MNKPHKNIVRLVEAWKVVTGSPDLRGLRDLGGLEGSAPQLVLAGREDPRYPEARQAVQRLGLADSVRFLGDVAENDMPALYSGALLFVFPSLYEGFGLPPLEAMACGAPVVCSTTPALLEIAGDAAMTVDPLDSQDMAQAMIRVLGDSALREQMRRRSLAQAARFSWRRTAIETLAEYHRLA
jgi:alpha-1,3-rhamnosyl/mannosyltransferase